VRVAYSGTQSKITQRASQYCKSLAPAQPPGGRSQRNALKPSLRGLGHAASICWTQKRWSIMSSLRRGILARFGGNSSNPRNRTLPTTVGRFDMRLHDQDDDSASIRTVLPPYSRNSSQTERPPSPAPSYMTVEGCAAPESMTSHSLPPGTDKPNPRAVTDNFILRLQETVRNPRTWRIQNNGDQSFFWALRCAPGTADILNDHLSEIKSAAVESSWRIEKFSVVFEGQTLGDLLCRPIHTEVSHRFESLTVDTWFPC
jgi:hypothetical protein